MSKTAKLRNISTSPKRKLRNNKDITGYFSDNNEMCE